MLGRAKRMARTIRGLPVVLVMLGFGGCSDSDDANNKGLGPGCVVARDTLGHEYANCHADLKLRDGSRAPTCPPKVVSFYAEIPSRVAMVCYQAVENNS